VSRDTRHEAAIERLYDELHDHELLTTPDPKWANAGTRVKDAFTHAYDAARGGERAPGIEAAARRHYEATRLVEISWVELTQEGREDRIEWMRLADAALGGEAEPSEQWLVTRVRSVLEGNLGLPYAIGTNDAERLAREIVAALSQHPEPRQAEGERT
jgi:hypothetical protein